MGWAKDVIQCLKRVHVIEAQSPDDGVDYSRIMFGLARNWNL